MNGVEILSSETIYNTILPEWCLGIAFAILVICAFIGALLCSFSKHSIIGLVIILLGACLWIGLMYCALTESKTDINYIEYKVTIDDSVSMNEFLDKYEILDQEGKIYTVKERE